jgi:methylated-DNA-[protein]-cysteine S-methyltransferase
VVKFAVETVQTRWASPLGEMALAASRVGLVGLWFINQRHAPLALNGPGAWPHDDANPLLQLSIRQLAAYFAGQRQRFELPLDLSGGTAFQQSVWRALLAIDYGCTLSYGDISRQIGKPLAVRAVGAAVGRNPVSLIVPCHRVLGQGGALTGYAGGLGRKTALLALEGNSSQRAAVL